MYCIVYSKGRKKARGWQHSALGGGKKFKKFKKKKEVGKQRAVPRHGMS